MRYVLIALLFLLLLSPGQSHEFWLEPDSFQAPSGQEVSIQLKVGERFRGSAWTGSVDKLERLDQYRGSDKRSLLAIDQPHFPLQLDGPGQYLVAFLNPNSSIELEPEKFESYLRSEGLGNVLKKRAEKGEQQSPGREVYRRCAKTLVQLGARGPHSYDQVVGLPLELVLEQNPHRPVAPTRLGCRLLYEGRPLPEAQVVVRHAFLGDVATRKLKTDPDGRIEFPFLARGRWLISSVHMVETDLSEADWQSFWASYTFGF